MTKLMRWLSRSVFHAHVDEDSRPSIAHIDARKLAASDFRSSDAMHLDAATFDDFCETLPSFVRGFGDSAIGAASGVVGRP